MRKATAGDTARLLGKTGIGRGGGEYKVVVRTTALKIGGGKEVPVKYHSEGVFSPDVVLRADPKLVSNPGYEMFHLYRHRVRIGVVNRNVLLQRRCRRHAHCLPLAQHIFSGWPRHDVVP